ncbi:hypothetical protein T09_9392 [Trichinella sp. T9]|nr:hypothetical protein T09_9392 [Trichinella sp. T9]
MKVLIQQMTNIYVCNIRSAETHLLPTRVGRQRLGGMQSSSMEHGTRPTTGNSCTSKQKLPILVEQHFHGPAQSKSFSQTIKPGNCGNASICGHVPSLNDSGIFCGRRFVCRVIWPPVLCSRIHRHSRIRLDTGLPHSALLALRRPSIVWQMLKLGIKIIQTALCLPVPGADSTNSSHETSNIERQRGSVMRFIDSRCERTNQANDQICRLGILETVSATLTRLKAALPRKPYEAELRGPTLFLLH